jgi:hypothetical protein
MKSYVCPNCRRLYEEDEYVFASAAPRCLDCDVPLARSPWFGTTFDHYWRVRTKLPERYRQRCRVVARGRMNSLLVVFADGHRVITSRHYVRRAGT